jgi:hypothetical protein
LAAMRAKIGAVRRSKASARASGGRGTRMSSHVLLADVAEAGGLAAARELDEARLQLAQQAVGEGAPARCGGDDFKDVLIEPGRAAGPQEGADRGVGITGPGHQDVAVVDRAGARGVEGEAGLIGDAALDLGDLDDGAAEAVGAEVLAAEGGAVLIGGALGQRQRAPAGGQRAGGRGLAGGGEQRGLVGAGARVALAAGAAVVGSCWKNHVRKTRRTRRSSSWLMDSARAARASMRPRARAIARCSGERGQADGGGAEDRQVGVRHAGGDGVAGDVIADLGGEQPVIDVLGVGAAGSQVIFIWLCDRMKRAPGGARGTRPTCSRVPRWVTTTSPGRAVWRASSSALASLMKTRSSV